MLIMCMCTCTGYAIVPIIVMAMHRELATLVITGSIRFTYKLIGVAKY